MEKMKRRGKWWRREGVVAGNAAREEATAAEVVAAEDVVIHFTSSFSSVQTDLFSLYPFFII